ncbi:MAG TPA: glycosyltransferase family 39 protein [Pirellulales bacterium]|jgi:4-amino-4-deoxy-L-arabinose transferase-like glycosyltransferase|nr:glycosyltransferase family 39 protein [Pirellulales bacterium]
MFRHQALVAIIAAVVFFGGLGRPRLWDDDESKNARCAQEMFDRGDWVVPTFNFRLRPDKPALFYWLAMISYELLGTTELAARLPSALLALGTCLMTYHLGRRLFRPEVGLWAGLAMATNWMFAVAGRLATPDSTLIFCTTAALLAYVMGVGKKTRGMVAAAAGLPSSAAFSTVVPRGWWSFVAVYAAMGLAVLAKGPVGVVLPVAAIGGFVWLEGSRLRLQSREQAGARMGAASRPPVRPEFGNLGNQLPYFAKLIFRHLRRLAADFPAAALAMRPFTLVLTVLAVALPWYACVAIRTHGQWWHEFFWNHNVQRFLEPREGHHGWLLFPPLTLLACFFPWSLLLPAALAAAMRRMRHDGPAATACRLMLVWSATWILFFSICGTKQTNYILPAYPALAVLVGWWIADWIADFQTARVRRLSAVWITLGLAGAVLSASILTVRHWLPQAMNPEAVKFGWIGLIPIAGAIAAWIFERRRSPCMAMASMAASSALLLALLLGGLAAPLSQEQNGVRLAEFLQKIPEQPSRLGQFRLAFVGLVYYADRKVEELATANDAAALFANEQNSLVATDPEGFEQLKALAPADLEIVAREPRFGRRGDMVLVGRSAKLVAPSMGDRVASRVAERNSMSSQQNGAQPCHR